MARSWKAALYFMNIAPKVQQSRMPLPGCSIEAALAASHSSLPDEIIHQAYKGFVT
jgi:hypothetical protein